MIAALFVVKNGCYFGLPNVDPWDYGRDARLYDGPWPVVAHPPCERWGNYAQAAGKKSGDDGYCFASALDAVMRFGGVLEHPAGSMAWDAFKLTKPNKDEWMQDNWGLWFCRVDQGHYGYPARKTTWLIYNGVRPPFPLVFGRCRQILPQGYLLRHGYEKAVRCGGVGILSKQQRQRTSYLFRDVLIQLAERAA